jgi:hypothetical protein
MFAVAALLILAIPAAQAQTYISACGGSFNLTKWAVSPPNPQAGDTVVLNATGTETGTTPLTGGVGVINAYLFGLEVFTAPFAVSSPVLIPLAPSPLSSAHCSCSHPRHTTRAPLAPQTCNATTIDVLGLATGYLSAPTCGASDPISQGQQGKIGFSLAIPSEGSGLGQLTIILSAADTAAELAYCANITLTL